MLEWGLGVSEGREQTDSHTETASLQVILLLHQCHLLSVSGFTDTYIYIQSVCSFCLDKNGPNFHALL